MIDAPARDSQFCLDAGSLLVVRYGRNSFRSSSLSALAASRI